MIRLATIDSFESEFLESLTLTLWQAFGVGCEYVGSVPCPPSFDGAKEFDAARLLAQIQPVVSFADDKVVYLTSRALSARTLPDGMAPTPGFSDTGKGLALVTTHSLPRGPEFEKRVARQMVHEMGHLWSLHHCLDPRCAMHPPWTPASFEGEATLCTFCRQKSEERIRQAKT